MDNFEIVVRFGFYMGLQNQDNYTPLVHFIHTRTQNKKSPHQALLKEILTLHIRSNHASDTQAPCVASDATSQFSSISLAKKNSLSNKGC